MRRKILLLADQCVERRLLCGELRCELLLACKGIIKLIADLKWGIGSLQVWHTCKSLLLPLVACHPCPDRVCVYLSVCGTR